jgi:hypothetical protein
MSRKYPCLLAVLVLGAGLAQADPRQAKETAERLWVLNLGDQPAEVSLDRTGAAGVRVEAGETVEAPELLAASGPAAVSKGADVLVIKGPGDFDASSLEIDRGKVRRQVVGKKMRVRVLRPEWARELLGRKERIESGQMLQARTETGEDGRVRLAVGLEKNSAVTVAIKNGSAVVRSFTVEASAPVRWRADLGSTAELGDARVELRVDRGRAAVAGVPMVAGSGPEGIGSVTAATTVGTASFSQNILYSSGSSHTFSVTGGPASTCGELVIKRNGNWEYTPNWLCTNGSGSATMGPWYWTSKADDETGEPVYILWPDNTTTTETFAIYDKESAVTYRDSAWGSPPTSYAGHATDDQWGAGFDFGGACFSEFQDTTTGLYWSPTTSSYNVSYYSVNANLSPSGRWYVAWTTSFPSAGAHVSGHSYDWLTCCHDGFSGYCTRNTFTKP